MKADVIKFLEEQSSAPSDGDGLPLISLWAAGHHLLMFFTLVSEQVRTHYSEKGRFRYHCPGTGCPACSVGLRPTEHLYLPVWELETSRVAVLYFHLGPNGPAQTILQFLKTYAEHLADVAAFVECQGEAKIKISGRTLLPDTDRGAIPCQEFCRGLDSGAVNLRSCAVELSVEAIAALPEVHKKSKPLIGDVFLPNALAAKAGPQLDQKN